MIRVSSSWVIVCQILTRLDFQQPLHGLPYCQRYAMNRHLLDKAQSHPDVKPPPPTRLPHHLDRLSERQKPHEANLSPQLCPVRLLIPSDDLEGVSRDLGARARDGTDGQVDPGPVLLEELGREPLRFFALERLPDEKDAAPVGDRANERHCEATVEVEEVERGGER